MLGVQLVLLIHTSQLGVTSMSGTTSSATGVGEAGLGSASKPASKSKSSSSKKEKNHCRAKKSTMFFSFLQLEDFDLEAGLEAKLVASPTPVALLVVPDIEVMPN